MCSAPTTSATLRDGESVLETCPKCSHIERDPKAAPAHHRDVAYGGDPGLDRVRLALTTRTLGRAAPLDPGSRVFEIGFGAGAMLRGFLDQGHRVAGCDPDQLHVEVDPQVLARAELHACGIEEVPASAEPADLVYGIHVVEHVQDVHALSGAAHRLLRPGGRVLFLTPAADSASLRAFSDAWWLLEDPTHVRFFSAASITRLLTDAGFVDVRVTRSLTDNLTMEGASIVRRVRPMDRPAGVLASRRVRWFAMALAPAAALLRLVRPRWRPTLVVTATRGAS
ncbi:class I SAM-dependent methyltransferase [Aeromicrobium duanguangcaii]|uniref:Class I SAM-dependent methyltransferase n=1 Tax=Aeromicrobium duanguangcaii TaxID=2968086 RepID=A0ABY5KAD3_9ACTN|nr:class I SAM-dependent methyltransferase [Aeromicrobium duanguangcaii]UUI67396.1 class I SAM-dependent methyltransferase [Aeromicrobium duanguangcaii]